MPAHEVASPLEVTDLVVTLGTSRILHGVSLRLESGDTVALMGPNGSGKSTLVKTLIGVHTPTSGTVRLFGHDVSDRTRRRLIGYVPQRIDAGGGIPSTVLEVVRSGLLGPGRLLPRRGDTARALAALERVGLKDRAHASVHTLSGGQAQRVLIARALVRDAEFLIMDEPLAGIDSSSKDALASTLAQLKDEGVTSLIVLHEIGALAPLLDYAITLEAGRIASIGPARPPEPGHDHPGHDHVHPHAEAPMPPRTPDLRD